MLHSFSSSSSLRIFSACHVSDKHVTFHVSHFITASLSCNKESVSCFSAAHPVCVLQVMVDVDDKNEWKECIDIGGVRLPTGYFFGASAATGDLSGGAGLNKDVIIFTAEVFLYLYHVVQ